VRHALPSLRALGSALARLSAVGNSRGLIIERPILDLFDITKDTSLEIKTDGEALIICPVCT